jgi:subtilisin-like proprotein convertase family protein
MRVERFVSLALCVAGSLAAILIFGSCRPRQTVEGRLAAAENREPRSFRLKKIGDPDKFSVRFYHDETVQDGQKLFVRWDVISRTSVDGATDCNRLRRTATALEYKMINENASRRADRTRYGGVVFNIDPKLFDKQCADATGTGYKVAPDCQKKEGLWNGPLQFEACVYADEAMTKLVRRGWGMPRLQPNLSVAENQSAGGFHLAEEIPDIDEVVNYGKLCAQKLGPMPSFKCTDGQIIPIKVDGQEIPLGSHTRGMKCDHPVYLGLGDDGQCVPYARLGRLDTGNPDVDTVFICRRYKIGDQFGSNLEPRSPEVPLHEDVAIISHNRKTGETCWYQALSGFQPNNRSLPTNRIPPPWESELPAEVATRNAELKVELDAAVAGISDEAERARKIHEFQSSPDKQIALGAEEFWIKPSGVQNFACVRCHDSDPFMLSPYVGQVKHQLPDGTKEMLLPCDPAKPGQVPDNKCHKRDGRGKYSMVSDLHNPPNWPSSFHIAPKAANAQLCVSCHRIGSINTCRSWALDSIGRQGSLPRAVQSARTDKSKSFPLSHWMPLAMAPGEANFDEALGGHTEIERWNEAFQRSADAMAECCQLNESNNRAEFDRKCTSTPITSAPPRPRSWKLKLARPAGIPDGSEAGVTLPLVADGDAVTEGQVVRSVLVKAKVKHPYIGHVEIWLMKDNSRVVKIYDGNAAEIAANADLDLQMASGMEGSPLNEFRGVSATGRWSVRIVDAQTHERGSLESVEIVLNTEELQ